MTVAEVIRQQTSGIRDMLINLEKDLAKADAERDAANERVKRCSTEITRQRALEGECKKSLNETSNIVSEAQHVLDEWERRRHEALESLLQHQAEQNAMVKSLHEAQIASETAMAEIREEQKTGQDAEACIARLRAELEDRRRTLRQTTLQALDTHLQFQIEQLRTAFNTEEQRADTVRAFEEFKKARHADPDISRLCEQREELQKLLNTAMVPGVRDILQTSLKGIEDQLGARFPVALTPPRPTSENQIIELMSYCNQDNKTVFFLPIDPTAWSATTDNEQTEEAMRLVWHFLHELNLRTEDGKFISYRRRPAFESRFGLEDVAILQGFSVRRHGSVVMQFVLSSVPIELQEALVYEDENI